MLRVLITGIAGFAGSHLVEHILDQGDVDVSGVLLGGEPTANIDPVKHRLTLVEGNLCDGQFVDRVFRELRPDYVFHLAAQANVHLSLSSPADTLVNNVTGQLCVLEAARKMATPPRVLTIGSADEYGLVHPDEVPVRETNPLRPTSAYSVSKIAQDMLGLQYFLSYRLPVVRVRPFNHIGPRQSEAFVTSSFAKQIAAAELGLGPTVVKVGNLEARRDFTDVRDMVRAYWLALQHGRPGEVYNLGSGRSRRIREALDLLVSRSRVPITVEVDPERLRPLDVPDVVCDSSLFRSITGWQPTITFEESLADLLDYWRARLRRAV
ncbi:MAG: GDP-mannose 4,6-dehydratase [Chloroflexota bacterium]